jgi:hypothetical protein
MAAELMSEASFTANLKRKLKSSRFGPVLKRGMDAVGYDYGHWSRMVMYRECFALLRDLGPSELDALEISAGEKWRALNFRSFTETQFPAFDICEHRLEQRFDLIIADQVFEHVLWPYRAARNVHEMLRPSGYFMVTVPFLLRLHDGVDCTRWSGLGLKYLLAECGFPLELTKTGQWGNRQCVKANFRRWASRGWFGSLHNEENFPVVAWALAQKPAV